MSKYTPTTKEVREAYSGGRSGEYHAVTGPEFDRWLAAHDAEVRKSLDPEMAMPCADTKPHSAHVWQMSATGFCLCAGVVTEGPEWEYGVRATGDNEPFTDHYDSLDAMSEEFDGRVVWNVDEEIVRRRKAGPWVPVKQEGADVV